MRSCPAFLCLFVCVAACGGDDGGLGDAATDAAAAADGSTARDAGVEDSGGDGATNGDGAVLDCREHPVTLVGLVETLVLIDGSASMEEPLGTSTVTRWDALRDALFGADGFITRSAKTTRIGLAIYGGSPTCPLPLDVLLPEVDNAAALEAAFPARAPGGAPAGAAALTAIVPLIANGGDSTNITLITASAPSTCEDTDAAPAWTEMELALNAAFNAGHYVRLVGIDSIGSDDSLERLAALSDGFQPLGRVRPGLSVATDATSLRVALEDQLTVVDCTYDVDVALDVSRGCEGTLSINGKVVPCGFGDGWSVVSKTRIGLTESACQPLIQDPSSVIAASFPCSSLLFAPGTCMTHADCGPLHAACSRGRCVECSSATDCETGELCRGNRCVQPCEDDAACSAVTPHCDPSTALCAGCLSDDDCDGAAPVCASDTQTCVGCQSASDCGGDTPLCSEATRRCVACTASSDCPDGSDCRDGACVAATSCSSAPVCDQPCPSQGVVACCRENNTCGCAQAPGGDCM